MRVLIADDEPIARRVLRELLEEFPEVEVAGEAATGAEAIELAQRLRPEVALLDLQMPEVGGFGVARALGGARLPLVIYVTAFERHALEAFETGALDYLLKPVRKERLAAALRKAAAQLSGFRKDAAGPRKIVGRLGADLHLLEPGEVIAFLAEREVVYIVTAERRYFAGHSLRQLESRLPAPFRRVHRAAIVNADHIRRISPLSSKRWLLRMSNGLEVVASKRLAGILRSEIRY